jgi:hypothetical protein
MTPSADPFPAECVRYIASRACNCQTTGPDVTRNRHYGSCITGRAQAYMGRRVEVKDVYTAYTQSAKSDG